MYMKLVQCPLLLLQFIRSAYLGDFVHFGPDGSQHKNEAACCRDNHGCYGNQGQVGGVTNRHCSNQGLSSHLKYWDTWL